MLIPLNIKSSYSLLKSTIRLEELVSYAQARGLPAIGLMDEEVFHGSWKFYQEAKSKGIDPLIGLTLNLARDSTSDQVLIWKILAKNYQAYLDLLQILNRIKLGEKISALDLLNASKDLILIFPLAENQDFTQHHLNDIQGWAEKEENIYLGIDLSFANQHTDLVKSANRFLAMDSFNYLEEEDEVALRIIEAIRNKNNINREELWSSQNDSQTYALSQLDFLEESYQNLGLKKVVDLTEIIAQSCRIDWPESRLRFPSFPLQKGEKACDKLRELTMQGLEKRELKQDDYINRLEKELSIIEEMGFCDYFLIVWDIMAFAKKESIQTGPGRGSAAASLVAYLLGIIDVDPVKYDLIFERFLNLERFSPPDIDLDFPDNKRQTIINYIQERYGEEHVAQIVTFGTLGAKQAIRDVGRVLKLSQDQLAKWSKAIPPLPSISLDQAYEESKPLQALVNQSDFNRSLFSLAKKIEGLPRNTSTHASGLIISDQDLSTFTPVEKEEGHMLQVQHDMDDLEDQGLVKFDILGLKNLTILDDAVYAIHQHFNSSFKLEQIKLNDEKTFRVFQKGKTNGIFQFESDGIKQVLRKLRPSHFEDIVAVIALYRPGPMAQIDSYIKRKHGEESVTYPHDSLKNILEPTYGILIYQEQIMRIAQEFAGYSLGEADLFRRAIGKKDQELIRQEKIKFVQGSLIQGHSEHEAEDIYQLIESFADYGFNRSHAVAYSMLAFQLAYIKAHYPPAFYSSILRSSSGSKREIYEQELLTSSVKVIGPDINRSYFHYTCTKDAVRLGFSQIKGLRRDFIQAILEERKKGGDFQDFIDFSQRLTGHKKLKESSSLLIKVGAFDSFEQSRGILMTSLDTILANLESGQYTPTLGEIFKPHYLESDDLTLKEKIEDEYEGTGFIFSPHPVDRYESLRNYFDIPFIKEKKTKNSKLTILSSLHDIKRIQTKRGESMAFLQVSDRSAFLDLTLFPESYRRYIQILNIGQSYVIEGQLEKRQDQWQMLVDKMERAEDLEEKIDERKLFLRMKDYDQDIYRQIEALLRQEKGSVSVYLHFNASQSTVKLKDHLRVNPSPRMIDKLQGLLGESNVVLTE